MPSYVQILAVGVWLDEVEDQEDADYARWSLPEEDDDLHTLTTLNEVLGALTADVRGLRVAVSFRTEEWATHVTAFANGLPWSAGEPADAPADDARAGKRTASASYAAFLAAEAEADAAIETDDAVRLLAALDGAGLAAPPIAHTRRPHFRIRRLDGVRTAIWRAIVTKRREALTLTRVLRAFEEEGESASHIVAYKLYLQRHLHGPLVEYAVRNALLAPPDPAGAPAMRVVGWVRKAIEEWPDFARDAGRLGLASDAPAPTRPTRTLAERIEAAVSALEAAISSRADDLDDVVARRFDRLLEVLSSASVGDRAEGRSAAGARLVALLAREPVVGIRTRIVGLLWALDVSAVELAPIVEGLPATSAVVAIREATREISFVSMPSRTEEPVTVLGVVCDPGSSSVADAAIARAECAAIPAQRARMLGWLEAMAAAFPDASFAYVSDGSHPHRARGGRIDWNATRPSAEEIIAGDLRRHGTAPNAASTPDAYRTFVAARAALSRAIEGSERGDAAIEAPWRLLSDPALSARSGPLRKLGELVRREAHEELTRAPRPVPTDLAVEAVMREPVIGFMLEAGLRARTDLVDAFGQRYQREPSATVREKLRELLGAHADRFATSSVLASTRTDSVAAPAETMSTQNGDSLAVALEAAIARIGSGALGAATPKRRRPADNAAFKEASALAEEAARSGELAKLLAALELPALAVDRGNGTRAWLWGKIVETRRAGLPFARVLQAYGEEVDEVVRAIGYRLYVQKHFEAPLLAVARLCHARKPAANRILSCVAYAASEWPDFSIPADIAPDLAKLLRG